MVRFNIPEMTCGACANRIGRALTQAGLPADLQVEIDVAARQVRIPKACPDEDALAVQSVIEDAGYTVEVAKSASTTARAPRAGGCCCTARRAHAFDAGQGVRAKTAGCCN